jgi:hypothetical protein
MPYAPGSGKHIRIIMADRVGQRSQALCLDGRDLGSDEILQVKAAIKGMRWDGDFSIEYDMFLGKGRANTKGSVQWLNAQIPVNRWCHVRREIVRLAAESHGPWAGHARRRVRTRVKGGYRKINRRLGPFDPEHIQKREHIFVDGQGRLWRPEAEGEFEAGRGRGILWIDNVVVRELAPCADTAR